MSLPWSTLARTPAQIGNIIRRARKQQQLSQTQLAEAAGLRQETISLLENGNPAARLETVLAVLASLDLELRVGNRTRSEPSAIEDIF